MSNDAKSVIVDSQSSIRLGNEEVLKYFYVAVDKATLRPMTKLLVEKLLSHHYVELAKMISIDFWLDLVDERTDETLKHPSIRFWYLNLLVVEIYLRMGSV